MTEPAQFDSDDVAMFDTSRHALMLTLDHDLRPTLLLHPNASAFTPEFAQILRTIAAEMDTRGSDPAVLLAREIP